MSQDELRLYRRRMVAESVRKGSPQPVGSILCGLAILGEDAASDLAEFESIIAPLLRDNIIRREGDDLVWVGGAGGGPSNWVHDANWKARP